MIIECPAYINTAIKLLENSGFKAFAVGGCVRDSIMGRVPNDWDMTTSASPEETMKVFESFRVIPTGLKHGTITVIIDGNPIEITTMRIDGEYHDNRRPDTVQFTSDIVKDLSRRDFTVNAMAYNNTDGLVDPFGGKDDIDTGIIRCVGNPDKRFNEDALRIMRAIRFASVLGFVIDSSTSESIFNNLSLIHNVANERIRVELLKLLQGRNVENILTEYKEVIFAIIPELRKLDRLEQNNKFHIYDVWTHTIKVVAGIKNTPNLRMSALLHDIGKTECKYQDNDGIYHYTGHQKFSVEISNHILKRLRFSNYDLNEILTIIKLHDCRPDGNKISIAKMCSRYSIETLLSVLEMMRGDACGKNPELYDSQIRSYNLAEQQLHEIEAEGLCLKISDLAVNGSDIVSCGFTGKEIGNILATLLHLVIEEKITNQKDVLIQTAKKLKNN